ncbi:MAG: type II secretion system F family protein, partial [Candidatus Korobacteraceae bacterium]
MLREIVMAAAKQTAQGMKLFDALTPFTRSFPSFFLPAVRCGEESGHLDETLRYLESHCRLLIGPGRTMRNMWFVPLCLMLAGTAFCTAAYCLVAPWAMTIDFIFDWLKFYAGLALAAAAFLFIPPFRELADSLRLFVPVIGPAERELSVNRFFHAMNLLYSTGGRRVEEMIRLAADSAGNSALRADFLRAAAVIESGGTISEAFSAVARLPFHYKATIMAGDEAGTLEDAFDSICRESGELVVSLLAGFQQLYFRIVAAMVILSIIGTFQSLCAAILTGANYREGV